MKVIVDKDIPFLAGVLEPFAEVVYLPGNQIVATDVRDADALIVRTRTRCDAALLEGSRVHFVGTATIGFDHIDREWCAANGITVCTAAGCNKRGVLQWVSAALAWLSVEKKFPERTTIGVIGVGNVGSLVAEYAAAWGFRVMRSDPPRERAENLGRGQGYYPLSEIVTSADIITFHVPLTASGPDATRHIVDADFLAATKLNAVILNSSRGPIVDPEALRQTVDGRLPTRSFIIDTWNDEPAIDRAVLERTLLATPHVAGYSAQGKANATAMTVNALARHFNLPALENWFPEGAPKSTPRTISWEEMCAAMPKYFDIAGESAALKAAPERFEKFRDTYIYRCEFF